jgi:diacylglycerol kinase
MQRWIQKFRCAFRGIRIATNGQSSFIVHGAIAFAVLVAGAYFSVSSVSWCILLICIAMVLAMETMNTAIEQLVQKLHPDHDPVMRNVLDMASGAVLIVSIGAACIGTIVFLGL